MEGWVRWELKREESVANREALTADKLGGFGVREMEWKVLKNSRNL